MRVERICVFVVIFILDIFSSVYITLCVNSMMDNDTNGYGPIVALAFNSFFFSMLATYTLYETEFLV